MADALSEALSGGSLGPMGGDGGGEGDEEKEILLILFLGLFLGLVVPFDGLFFWAGVLFFEDGDFGGRGGPIGVDVFEDGGGGGWFVAEGPVPLLMLRAISPTTEIITIIF